MHGLRLMRFAGSPKASKHCQQSKVIVKTAQDNLNVAPNTISPNVNLGNSNNSETKTSKKPESLDQLFRLPPYGTNSGLKILRRPRKINDHKVKKVSVSKIYSGKIDALKKVGKQKVKVNKKITNYQSRHVIIPNKCDKVKVLFTSKKWKTKKKNRALPRYSSCINFQKHDIIVRSKSSLGSQRLRKSHHVCCRLQMPWRSRYHKHKNKKKSDTTLPCHPKNCRNFHSDPLINIKKSKKLGPCENCIHTPSLHYNLVEFPHNAKDRRKQNEDSFLKVKANTGKLSRRRADDNLRSYANKEVFVTPSFLKGGGDTYVDRASQVNPKKSDNDIWRRVRCYKSPHVNKCAKRKNPTHISLFLANKVLKYILFGLSILVWSPCILITFLIWIITYPMRPQEIIDTVNNAQMKKHKKCHRHKNEFLTAIYEGSKSFIKKIMFFYESVFSLLKTERQKTEHCCKKRRKESGPKSPNPDKKYTLFYNDERGWVIKPIKSSNRIGLVENNNNCFSRNIRFKDNDIRHKNLQPEQACQVNFTFGQMKGPGYRKKSKFSLPCLKVSQAFHNKGQQHKKSIKTQAYFDYNVEPGHSILDSVQNSQIIVSDSCEVQTNFLHSSKPDIPVYATLQNRKYVTFETEYPECDPCNVPPPPIKPFCPNDVSTKRHLSKCRCVKILRKIKPQQNPPKYIKVKKYDNTNNVVTMRQHVPKRMEAMKQYIPKRMETKQYIPQRMDTMKQYIPKRTDTVRQNIPIRNEPMRKNIPKRQLRKENVSKRSTFNRKITKPRKNWFKNRGFGRRFKKKFSDIVNNAEKNMWNYDKCEGTLYVQTLRRKPCYWIYKRAPSFYPYFMIYYKFYENMVHGALIIMTACIWCPVFLWCYCCAILLCRFL